MNLIKICSRCSQEKLSSDFYKGASECKVCSKERMKKLYEANPGLKREYATRYKLKKYYGLTPEDRISMLERCNYKCQICGTAVQLPEAGGGAKNANIDHCHTTGSVRGILCGHCNKGLGHFRDDPGIIQRASQYIQHRR